MCKRIIALTLSMLMLLCLLPAAVAEQDGWSVIGGICGTNWDTDFAMTEIDEDVWKSESLELYEGEMLKVRFGGSWDLNYGIDWNWDGGDPVVCAQDGRNLVIPADNTYTVTLTLSDPVTITLTNAVGETVLPLTEDDPEPIEEPDPIPLTEAFFPDANFRAWIAAQNGWTAEEDGVTYVTGSALLSDYIDCSGLGIEDLTGVEYFTELISLNCADRWDDDGKHVNNITALDLSGNTKLVSLNAACNKLTELDVSMLSELKWLILDLNELETLEVNHGALEQCHCAGNHLTELDVSDNPNLWDLQCGTVEWWEEDTHYYYANEIRTLNVSNCTRIVDLNCAGNPLETIIANNSKTMRKIKLSEYPNLSRLECADCGLTSLNLSENPNLTHLNCENNRLLKLNFTAADGADPENFLLDGQSMPVTAGARENNGAYTLDMRQIVGDDYGRVRMAGYDPDTGVATFAENPDEITYIYQTQPSGDTIGMTVTVQLNVAPEPLPDGAIAINSDNFPDKAFRTWILDNLDYSEDALLSPYFTREQLEAVTTVGWFEAGDITGVTLFPNLSRLECYYIKVFPLPLPDYPICGDVVLCPGQPTEGANGTYTFDFSTVLDPAVYPFERFDTSDWGDDKQLDTETGVVTFRYRPEQEEFRIPETYEYDEDWKDDLYIRLLFDDNQNPNDPGEFPFFVDEYDDPSTAFNSAGDDPWIPDQSEWPAAPAYDGSLDGIPIDEAHFPDAIFREWVLENLDHETDGENHWFTGEQRWNVTVIVCLGLHIESLAGIEYFPNLEWLYCGRQGGVYVPEYAFWTYTSNPIASLDLSGNPKLTRLYAGYCKLTEIDLSDNPNLTHLSVFGNRLTELDLSHNGLIEELNFGCNDIRSFDPSQVPNLTILRCYFTSLAGDLDLSDRPMLTELRCCNIHGDNMTSLNISGCTGLVSTECEIYNFSGMTEFRCRNCGLAELQGGMGNLQILDCGDNPQFTSLDLSDYRELRELYCDNCNLYRLDISKNTHLNTVDCSENHLKQLNFTLVSGGTFNGNDQTGVCAAKMEPNGDGYTFDMSAIVSSENLDRIIAIDGAEYDPHTGIATFTAYAETLSYTYRTQHYSASDPRAMPVTVELNVPMPDLPEGAIPIDAEHFPDANFRAWILKSLTPYYTEDEFGRQYLTDTRYDAIYFGMDGWGVASLEGLQYFPNAFSLMCGEGHRQDDDGDWIWHAGALTEVDFSQNPNLVEVYLTGNQLETIDVSCLPILQWLGVRRNRLTTIDVSANANLAALYCGGNNLTSIVLPGQNVSVYPLMRGEQQEARLTRLECEDNALETLDLSMQTALIEISCENNALTALDLSENEHIGLLDCDDEVAITLPEGMSICAQMTINEGEKTYQCTSLAAAVDKITGKDGVTDPGEVQSAYITVLEDMTGPALEFAEDQQKTVVIDLNGHTYTAESEPALITYENDVTVINGEIVVNPTPAPEFRTQSLTLDGSIGVNFYMDLSMLSEEELADCYMTFAITGKGTVDDTPVPVSENQMNSKGTFYGFTCRVNSVQMADTITATFHYGDGLTVEKDYSVAEYIESFEESVENGVYNEDDHGELITLVHALADYGHYMQLYLADTKDLPLGAGEDAYMPMDTFYNDDYDPDDVADCLTEDFTINVSCSDTNIKSLNYTVAFESETTLRLIFKPASGFTGDLYVDAGNGDTAVPLKSKRWTVEIPNIPAHLLGEAHDIQARTDNSGTACLRIGNLSVMTYVLQMLNGSDAAKNAGCAVCCYWQAAVAFRNAQNN